jgi:hypothetical protein
VYTPFNTGWETFETIALYFAPEGSNAGFHAANGDSFAMAGLTINPQTTRPTPMRIANLLSVIYASFLILSP